MTIKITTNHSRSSYGIPVCLIDGELVDDSTGIKAAMKALRWKVEDAATATGKTPRTIIGYRTGQFPIPADVWNVLRDALEGE